MILQWVQHEKKEFLDHHRSIINILIHIVCGIVYMSGLLLLVSRVFCRPSSTSCVLWWIIFYATLCMFLFPESWLMMIVMIVLLHYTTSYHFFSSMSSRNLFLLSFVFYMLPDIGHFLSKEAIIVSIHNVISNIFFLLPLSLQCIVSVSN